MRSLFRRSCLFFRRSTHTPTAHPSASCPNDCPESCPAALRPAVPHRQDRQGADPDAERLSGHPAIKKTTFCFFFKAKDWGKSARRGGELARGKVCEGQTTFYSRLAALSVNPHQLQPVLGSVVAPQLAPDAWPLLHLLGRSGDPTMVSSPVPALQGSSGVLGTWSPRAPTPSRQQTGTNAPQPPHRPAVGLGPAASPVPVCEQAGMWGGRLMLHIPAAWGSMGCTDTPS